MLIVFGKQCGGFGEGEERESIKENRYDTVNRKIKFSRVYSRWNKRLPIYSLLDGSLYRWWPLLVISRRPDRRPKLRRVDVRLGTSSIKQKCRILRQRIVSAEWHRRHGWPPFSPPCSLWSTTSPFFLLTDCPEDHDGSEYKRDDVLFIPRDVHSQGRHQTGHSQRDQPTRSRRAAKNNIYEHTQHKIGIRGEDHIVCTSCG